MNRFIGLIIMVVAVAALAGAAIGWRFPFLGQSRSRNQIGTAQEGRASQSATLKQSSGSKGKVVAQNTNKLTAQTQNTNVDVDTSTTVNNQSGQSDSNQPVPALW